MYDCVETLGTIIRKAREGQGMSQASLVEKLGIDIRTTINIGNFHRNPKFKMLYPLVTTLRTPANRIFYPETGSMGDSKQQLFQELHSLSEKKALELLPIIRCLAEMIRKHGSENP